VQGLLLPAAFLWGNHSLEMVQQRQEAANLVEQLVGSFQQPEPDPPARGALVCENPGF
jgi:hypothetical protein